MWVPLQQSSSVAFKGTIRAPSWAVEPVELFTVKPRRPPPLAIGVKLSGALG